MNNSMSTLLVDTGADISVIKRSQVLYDPITENEKVNINGIGQGLITTIGKVKTELLLRNISIKHEFHVVEDNFPILGDGIIGMDFIRKYKCILDFSGEQDLLILTDEVPCEYNITLHDCPEHLTIPLPARSVVIRPISFDTEVEEVFVPQQMLQNGVFIANTITTKSNPLVKIINVTDRDIMIQNCKIKVQKHSDYRIANVSSENKNNNNSEKLKKLSKKFSDFVKTELT